MSAVVIDLQHAEDLRDVVHRTVEILSAGKVVAVPTDTVYGLIASALHPDAIDRIFSIKGRDPAQPLAIAAKSLEDALDYVPDLSLMGRRIARRSWPGPMTIVHSATHSDSVIHRLDEKVKAATIPEGKIGLRVPAHDFTLQVMRLCAGPIVMTSADPANDSDPTTAQQVQETIGEQVDLILDDGPSKLGRLSSVVEVADNQVTVLREGVVDAKSISRLGNFMAVIVCTGNTCRSPMGEALFKELAAEKLGCSIDELSERGILVASAGIAAMPGAPATPQAVEVMGRLNLEIGDHASQPITGGLAQWADLILTMTNRHRQALIAQWPMLEPRTRTIRKDGGDISDPIGSPVEIYEACAKQIRDNLKQWIDEIDWSPYQR